MRNFFIFFIFIIFITNVSAEYFGDKRTDEDGHFNVKRGIFKNIVKKLGTTGFVLRWHEEKNPSKFEIVIPKQSPPIISDFKSQYGVLGGSRSAYGSMFGNKHEGVDFYIKPGEPILAANDGKVVMVGNDGCAGPYLVIKHTGNKYATYIHVGKIHVKKGDKIQRGKIIADGGKEMRTDCGGGIEHLHFQLSSSGPCRQCTGSWKYTGEDNTWLNPHKYWTGGKGKPECFVKGKEYPKKLMTLPVACY